MFVLCFCANVLCEWTHFTGGLLARVGRARSAKVLIVIDTGSLEQLRDWMWMGSHWLVDAHSMSWRMKLYVEELTFLCMFRLVQVMVAL